MCAAASPIRADPHVMQEFTQWFQDLRADMRRKAAMRRGHSNPVVVLVNSAGDVQEVEDEFSKFVRTEEQHREALVSAEAQWRAFVHRTASFPRGPAAIASRASRSIRLLQQHWDFLQRNEMAARQLIVEARAKWLEEIYDRAQYEFKYMCQVVSEALRRSFAARGIMNLLDEEAGKRREIQCTAVAWFRTISTAGSAHLAHTSCSVRSILKLRESNRRAFGSLEEKRRFHEDDEMSLRTLIADAEREHRQMASVVFAKGLADMSNKVEQQVVVTRKRLFELMETVFLYEGKCRRRLEEACSAHLCAIHSSALTALSQIQLHVAESMQKREVEQFMFVERVEKELFAGERFLRLQIVEAYIRWAQGVLSKDVTVLQRMQFEELQKAKASAAALRTQQQLLLQQESSQRGDIEKSRGDWLERQFLVRERMERQEVPARSQERFAAEIRRAESAKRPPVWVQALFDEEITHRRMIAHGESQWRLEIARHRLCAEAVLTLAPHLVERLQQVERLENGARTSIIYSEQQWRDFAVQSRSMAIARTERAAKNSRPGSRGGGSKTIS